MPMLASSQKPDRVSNILRSSTRDDPATAGSGAGAGRRCRACAAGGRCAVRCDGGHADCSFSLGVGGELEEHLLQAGAVGGAQLGEGDAGLRGRPCRPARGRRRRAGRRCRRTVLDDVMPAPCRARGERRRRRAVRTRVPAAREQLGLGALGDDPAVADHDQVVGDDLDLVQQVRGEQHGAAAVGVRRAAGRASSGCRPGRGRWPARRGSAPRVAEQRGGDAEPLAHAERVVADPALGLGSA